MAVNDGVNGQGYDQTVEASGGSGARSWTISSGALPDGLNLDGATGTISGTPSATGTFDFTVQVQDSGTPPQTDTQALTIRIADPLSITTPGLPNASEDDGVYSASVEATGGIPPFTWSVSSGLLPTGLDLDGSITETLGFAGNPRGGGQFEFTLQITDSASPAQVATQAFTVLVLEITTDSIATAIQNDPYSFTVSAAGFVPPLSWSIFGLPSGLSINPATGEISGTPTQGGITGGFFATVTDSDVPPRTDQRGLGFSIIEDLVITTGGLANGTTGAGYSSPIIATGGTRSYTWSEPTGFFSNVDGFGVTGTACEGLRFNLFPSIFTSGTVVSGTPVAPGTCGPLTVRVDDSGEPAEFAQFDEESFTITVTVGPLAITTASLPGAAVNRTYLGTIGAAGGIQPFSWSEMTDFFDDLTGAGAPATPCEGLTLDFVTGEIRGTPALQGICGPFTVEVTDSATPTADTALRDFTIEVGSEPPSIRNDTVATATDLGTAPAIGGEIRVTASISPFGAVVAGVTPNPADNDFYQLTAPASATLSIEVVAQRLANPSQLDSLLQLVTDNGTDLGVGNLTTCRESGDDPNSTTGTVSGVNGADDSLPERFDDFCFTDDIVLGVILDSRLEFQVPSSDPFYIRVVDWRGHARPDFLYELVITRVN